MPVLIHEGPPLKSDQHEAIIKGLTEVACKVLPEVPKQAFYISIWDHN